MSMFSSISQAIQAVCSPIISLATTTDKTLKMATTYVDNRAISLELTDKQQVIHDTTEKLRPIQDRLNKDEEFSKLFEEVSKHFE